MTDSLRRFLAFSSEVMAFTEQELQSTGQAQAYLTVLEEVLGKSVIEELLDAYDAIPAAGAVGNVVSAVVSSGGSLSERERHLRQAIFGHEKFGSIARNILKLWYYGSWFALPVNWNETYGPCPRDIDFVVSLTSYTEGLLWRAIGAHPAGAKAQGFGSWVDPPTIPPF